MLNNGATGGLGRAFAHEAGKRGYDLILIDLDDDNLNKLKSGTLRMYPVEVKTFAMSITIQEDTYQLWEYLKTNNIKLDMLINNAGGDKEGYLAKSEPSIQTWIADLNCVGTLRMMTNSLVYKKETFRIINIASMAGFYQMPQKAVYSASKRFLIDLGYSLNNELNPENVFITSVCPAGLPTKTEIIKQMKQQGLAGKLTTINVGNVAKKSFDKSLQNKKIYVPGLINQATVILTSLVPKTLLTKMIGKRWNRLNKVKAFQERG